MSENDHAQSILKGVLVGLIAGLAASWTMNRFQDVWLALSSSADSTNHQKPDAETEENATVKAASAVSEKLFGHKLTTARKKAAGTAVHYAVGATAGIVYCVASELSPKVTKGFGLPYGAAFWLVIDEGVVPSLGLSKTAGEYPLSTHAYALASHLVYGATAEGTRRLLR
jgi:uncharacterized membrane protein YagU involved in acid resistance